MPHSSHREDLQRSRDEILAAIGADPDLVLVRGIGNLGDELIWAGTRRLLEGHVYREIGVEDLPGATGDTVVICGGGAFCHPFHEFMPQLLAVAELRFDRVIVLPSSFDTSVDAVRAVLRRTSALVFAREQESYNRIRPLCDARLAHDCAFFFDFAPYRTDGPGEGTLDAFRTDREAAGDAAPPPGNDDISLTAASLDDWLRRIAAHELVRTDRAHVMIAAAMLDKRVDYRPSSYFKVPAIARYALSGFPVSELPTAHTTDSRPPALRATPCPPQAEATRRRLQARAQASRDASVPLASHGNGAAPRIQAVILSHERPELALGAIHSVLESADNAEIPIGVLVLDNNSSERTRRILSNGCSEHESIELRLLDRNLGCAGGRRLGTELTDSELVLFLDDDAELMPETLARLVSQLDGDPQAQGVSATVVLPDEVVSHSGGWYRESRELVTFTLAHSGLPLQQTRLGPSGPCDWLPGTAALVRRAVFERFPLDSEMSAYYEDTEWSLRVARALPGCFLRCSDALVLHHAQPKPWGADGFKARAAIVEMIAAAAHFHRRHDRLLRVPGVDVFAFMPGLLGEDGAPATRRARMLMELADSRGSDWLLMQWCNGGLDPLIGGPGRHLAGSATDAETNGVHAELEALRGQLEEASERVHTAERERHEAWDRLQRIYGSRLWKLGTTYDRARRQARRISSLGGSR